MIHQLSALPQFLDAHTFAILDENVRFDPPCPAMRISGGELCKTRAFKEQLEDALLLRGVHRNSTLLAIGGGTLLDLVGFTAATYMRGIPYLSIPTTHLAMVDACYGGKVAVNTPHGKNTIGAFHPPRAIFLDPAFLNTLSPSEIRNGTAETFKHALIASPSLFAQLESGVSPLALIADSLQIKRTIVDADPFDRGLRAILNFGHTVGHALELLSNFTLPHGAAVAYGCVLEAELSQCPDLPRIRALFDALGFVPIPYDPHALYSAMQRDKKRGYIPLTAIGHANPVHRPL